MTYLETVLRQTAGDLIASGKTNPDAEDFRKAFLARLQRNNDICERYITDISFRDTITDQISREVWQEIRGQYGN